MANRTFKRGSGVYTCRVCGKRTRDVHNEEGQAKLCSACYDEAGWENTHSDEGHASAPDLARCPICQREAAAALGIDGVLHGVFAVPTKRAARPAGGQAAHNPAPATNQEAIQMATSKTAPTKRSARVTPITEAPSKKGAKAAPAKKAAPKKKAAPVQRTKEELAAAKGFRKEVLADAIKVGVKLFRNFASNSALATALKEQITHPLAADMTDGDWRNLGLRVVRQFERQGLMEGRGRHKFDGWVAYEKADIPATEYRLVKGSKPELAPLARKVRAGKAKAAPAKKSARKAAARAEAAAPAAAKAAPRKRAVKKAAPAAAEAPADEAGAEEGAAEE